MYSQIAAIAEYYGVGIFTVAVITDGAFTIGFIAWRRLSVDSRCRA